MILKYVHSAGREIEKEHEEEEIQVPEVEEEEVEKTEEVEKAEEESLVAEEKETQATEEVKEAKEEEKTYEEYPDLLKVKDIAKIFNVSYWTVLRWAKKGEFGAFKQGKEWFFLKEELTDWFRSKRKDSKDLRFKDREEAKNLARWRNLPF